MNESLLEALVQLFSIVAEVDGINDKSRDTVKSFLNEELSPDLVNTYLIKYDQFVERHHFRKSKKGGEVKQTSRNSVKILRIGSEINRSLNKQQKMLVVFRLVEYIYEQNILSSQNIEFLEAIVSAFNIDRDDFEFIKQFIALEIGDTVESNRFLFVNGKGKNEGRFYFHHGLDAELPFLWLEQARILAFRKLGSQELILNGQPIKKKRAYFFRQGASIKGPKIQPIYFSDILGSYTREAIKDPILFQAKEIEYVFKRGEQGLHPMTFTAESGEIVGIMGGSGTGKSTLMNVLNGNYHPTRGSVEINGINLYNNQGELEGLIGYVPQDDLLIEELTVFQNLYYNARLSFANLSKKDIQERVISILQSLGLSDARDLKVGSPLEKTISGGQRKRLNISLELIREPSVMFVDEPTSGLSSRDSENIMDLLNELTLKGKVIFVVIHQPSSEIFKLFDKLLILDKGGYLVFQGNPLAAISYFKEAEGILSSDGADCSNCGNVNPEQIFDIIEAKVVDEYGDLTRIRKHQPQEWRKRYIENLAHTQEVETKKTNIPDIDFCLPNWWKQFSVFVIRDVLAKVSSLQYLLVNLLEAPVLALIIAGFLRFYNDSTVYGSQYVFRNNDNILAYIFLSVVVALFLGLSVSAEEIIKDLKIRQRESFLNLSKSGYLGSKVLILFSLSAVQMLSYVLVGNYILEIRDMYLDYWLVLFSSACFANVLGLNISASFKNVVTIYILIPFIIIPQILFSGVLVKYENLNPWLTSQKYVPVIGDLMASRWAFEALAVHQASDNKFEKHYFKTNQKLYDYSFKKNYWIPEMESSLGFLSLAIRDPDKVEKVINTVRYLHKEFSKLPENEIQHFKGNMRALARGVLEVNTIAQIDEFLTLLDAYYGRQLNKAIIRKDQITIELKEALGGDAGYKKLKFDYENERLLNYLNNKNDLNKIVEIGGELVRKENKMYELPRGYLTHYFAPKKFFMGKYYNTFNHNIAVLWAATVLLMFSLYFGWLPKFMKLFSRFLPE